MAQQITGKDVWMLLDGRRTVAEVAEELSRRSGLPVDAVLPSVIAFVTRLREAGLIDPAAHGGHQQPAP